MKNGSGIYVVLKRYDDTGHEAVIGQYRERARAVELAHQSQRRASLAGHAATYTVIEQVRNPLAVLRRRVTT